MKLLLIKRAEFSISTEEEDVASTKIKKVKEENEILSDYVRVSEKAKKIKFNLFVELQKPYYKLFLVLTMISLIAFAAMAVIVSFYDYYDYIGPFIMISRGCASAILGT